MKRIILIAIFLMASSPAWGESPRNIPSECKGKEIHCSGGEIFACTLMYCPLVNIYDDKGKFVRSEESCHNQCSRSPLRCSCGSIQWEE
jgi:hypothetical protein